MEPYRPTGRVLAVLEMLQARAGELWGEIETFPVMNADELGAGLQSL